MVVATLQRNCLQQILRNVCVFEVHKKSPYAANLQHRGSVIFWGGYSFTAGLLMGIEVGSGRFSTLESLISFLGHTVAQRPQLVHLE